MPDDVMLTSVDCPVALAVAVIGASVSEPPSSDVNGDFLYIYIYILLLLSWRTVVRHM